MRSVVDPHNSNNLQSPNIAAGIFVECKWQHGQHVACTTGSTEKKKNNGSERPNICKHLFVGGSVFLFFGCEFSSTCVLVRKMECGGVWAEGEKLQCLQCNHGSCQLYCRRGGGDRQTELLGDEVQAQRSGLHLDIY